MSNFDYRTLPKNEAFAESFDVYMCNGYSLPSFAIKFLKEESASYEARENDVYVISYPKTGTTWTQEIVYLIQSGLNFDHASAVDLGLRFPYVEHASMDINYIKNMPSPRLIKSHLPYSLLPPDIIKNQCKIIYVTRNPKDVVVSYYHFACWLKETQYKGTFDQFFERFISNRTTYSPFLQHNVEFWNKRNDSNVLFLFYEDLQQDLPGNVKRIANFLGKSLNTEEINAVIDHCSFKRMSANNSEDDISSKFFRKGKVGDWKNYFNDEQSKKMDEWIENVLQNTGLSYIYEF